MVGSYKASDEIQVKRFESEEAPSGMMSRGSCSVFQLFRSAPVF